MKLKSSFDKLIMSTRKFCLKLLTQHPGTTHLPKIKIKTMVHSLMPKNHSTSVRLSQVVVPEESLVKSIKNASDARTGIFSNVIPGIVTGITCAGTVEAPTTQKTAAGTGTPAGTNPADAGEYHTSIKTLMLPPGAILAPHYAFTASSTRVHP